MEQKMLEGKYIQSSNNSREKQFHKILSASYNMMIKKTYHSQIEKKYISVYNEFSNPPTYEEIVKPFNSSFKEYVSCREEREECRDKKVFSDVSSIYDETRVKDLPPVQKNIEYVKPPNDPPPPRNTEPFLNNTNSFSYKEFESGEQNVIDEPKITQQPSEVSKNYKALIFTVLATTSVYYFFFKLSK
jgi:hypothetical protein